MFENAFSFDGRIRRTEYGLSLIFYVIIAVIINLIAKDSSDNSFVFIFYIPMLWFLWAQAAKRCHDVGNSGWWQLIPLYGLWLLFQEGDAGTNNYGDNPKGNQNQTTSYNSTNQVQPPTNSVGGYNQGNYSGGHNNHNSNIDYSNSQSNPNNKNSSGEYNSGELYK